jgi:hypothetical protein
VPQPVPSKGMRSRELLVYDAAKEKSRTYRRSVYDFDYWANHRSTTRYFFHIVSLPNSRIIRSLGAPIAWYASPLLGCAAQPEPHPSTCLPQTSLQSLPGFIQGDGGWPCPNSSCEPTLC